jgi:CheY-like chemotaxis protein
MGGRIWATSGVGEGSVFSFTMPLKISVEAPKVSARPVGASPEEPLPALRILLVEDSADNCAIFLAYLKDTPYQVEIAETGAVACAMFQARRYDLVLMDRQMPVMDGLTATRTIRTWEQGNDRPPTPIIALTASALKGDREKCIAAGCTAYLTKPIKQAALLQAIKEQAATAYKLESGRTFTDPKVIFADRIPGFLENCKRNVVAMRGALDLGNFETVKFLSHAMRGTGGMLGFQTISDISASLEQAAEDTDTDASRKWIGELSGFLDGVETVAGRHADQIVSAG